MPSWAPGFCPTSVTLAKIASVYIGRFPEIPQDQHLAHRSACSVARELQHRWPRWRSRYDAPKDARAAAAGSTGTAVGGDSSSGGLHPGGNSGGTSPCAHDCQIQFCSFLEPPTLTRQTSRRDSLLADIDHVPRAQSRQKRSPVSEAECRRPGTSAEFRRKPASHGFAAFARRDADRSPDVREVSITSPVLHVCRRLVPLKPRPETSMTAPVHFPVLDAADCEQVQVDLIDLVLSETHQWVHDLRSAAADRDRDRMLTLLEALKSSMSIFGVELVCKIADDIEQLVEHRRWSELRPEIVRLSAMCGVAVSDLRRLRREAVPECESLAEDLRPQCGISPPDELTVTRESQLRYSA